MSVVPDDLIKLLLSLVLGGLIGWERELYDKPAGFRTNTLICVGATLFTIFSLKIGTIPATDSARIAAQIVSGIGFLGAGAIIRRGEAVFRSYYSGNDLVCRFRWNGGWRRLLPDEFRRSGAGF